MPYIKDVGHTPKYIPNRISRYYTLQKAKFISKNIPCTYIGRTITFDDSYEAYVLKLEKMQPWQRFVHSIYS